MHAVLPEEERVRLYGGDILLTPRQREIITEMEQNTEMELKESTEGGVEKRAVVRTVRDLWPGGIVPYTISSVLSTFRPQIN